jgi:serine protease Do
MAGTPAAWGQTAAPVALERQGAISPDSRAKLYRELQSQTEVLEKTSAVVKTVAKLMGPTVVHIRAEVPRRNPDRPAGQGQLEEDGSGVIIDHRGQRYVLTNRHVISGAAAENIHITLADGREIHPQQVWEDPETDAAVMWVSAPDLVSATLGDSSRMEIGDFVLAVGSPFGLSQSVTFGIISAKGRRGLDLPERKVKLQDFLQTDAAINPGNSGGPLINLHGEVIGINACIASKSGGSEGIGFAIPINMFMIVARQLIESGRVAHAFLGVSLDDKFGPASASELGLPRPVGARVTAITPQSPAAFANLQRDDVILQFDGTPIEDDAHLVNLVNLTQVGKQVALVILRERKTMTLKVEVDDRDSPKFHGQ